MTKHERSVAAERPTAAPESRSRFRRVLDAMGRAAVVIAVVVMVNLGSLPTGLTIGQLAVAFVALSVAVEAVRWIRRGPRQEARLRFTKAVAEYGGGLYGTAALATFIWLNVTDVLNDVAAAGSLGAYVAGMSLAWLIGEMVEAVIFFVQAIFWPWHWFSSHGPMVALAIGSGVLAFDAAWKSVGRWIEARRSSSRCRGWAGRTPRR